MSKKFVNFSLLTLLIAAFSVAASAATYTVTKTADTNDGTCDADCSLREAVAAANASADDDTIVFSSLFDSEQTITLAGTEIVFAANGSLTITGPGAALLTISGNNASRIISTGPNVVANISGITFTAGNGVGALNSGRAGAIYNAGGTLLIESCVITGNSASNGGGLNNASAGSPAVPGNLTLRFTTVSNNTASGSGGGMQNFSTSTIIIDRSAFIGNVSNGTTGGGGGQFNGAVRITNSTFANNSAPSGSGGGMQSNGTIGAIITNSTFSGNSSLNNGGGIHRGSTNVNFFIRNTIVAGNDGTAVSPDITNSAGGIQSQGNNIIGVTGTSTGWIGSDLLDTDPMLGPLGSNGGPTQSFVPMPGSPAIDAGQNCVLDLSCAANNPPEAVVTDQRGISRPQGPIVDIGSVEVEAAGAPAVLGGRVLFRGVYGLPNAAITVTDGVTTWRGRTSSFGYFRFEGLPTGITYTITVSDKRESYGSLDVELNGDTTDIEITPAALHRDK